MYASHCSSDQYSTGACSGILGSRVWIIEVLQRYTTCSFVFKYGPDGTSDPRYSHTIATSFMGPMLLSLLVMVVLYVKMFLGLQNRRLVVEQNRALVKSVSLYPLVQMVCWMPFVCVIFNIFHDTPGANMPMKDYIPFQTLETWIYVRHLFDDCSFETAWRRRDGLVAQGVAAVPGGRGGGKNRAGQHEKWLVLAWILSLLCRHTVEFRAGGWL